ncbi:hypothetical protein NLU13_1778 [Sarocladium strictum]|uniref:Major facilitator superfamily (MFS) profile domain-containing protein n=1 Tax=Sarocladium strictum TaxID=5046 RepID=A0AA39LCL2_SARSR|nr:hypothetical protein NLU13_1778 [Sarocladium strictum]
MHLVTNHLSEDAPPGTSLLVTEATEVVLVPEPSADPNDPLNWSMTRKIANVAMMYTVTIVIFSILSMQAVFWPQMSPDLNVTFDELNASLACNAAGLCAGCLFFIPLARKYGRRTPYILSMAVMAATAWWSARMQTLTELYLTNIILGLAGSMNETLSEMTVADLFFVHQRGRANAWYIVSVMLGATIIPTIAGQQAQAQGWRWSYYTIGIFLTVITFVLLFFFEETKYLHKTRSTMGQSVVAPPSSSASASDSSKNKVSQAGELQYTSSNVLPDDGDQIERGSSEDNTVIPPMNSYRQRLRWFTPSSESLWKTAIMPLRTAVLPHVLYTALQAAYLLTFLVLLSSVSPTVFSAPPYNFGPGGVGLMLVGPFIGNALGCLYAGLLGDWIGVFLAKRNNGVFEPEFRLWLLVFPSIVMGGGLILYGASIERGWHWIFPNIGGGMFTFAMGSIIDMSFTLIIDTYTEATAEAFVFITFVRNLGTVGLPFGITPWMTAMSLTNMFIISGTICTALGLLCIPMIIWGKAMRSWSKPLYEKLLIDIQTP